MEITRLVLAERLELAVEGRLDGYWADHLDAALADAVRAGYHQIHVDCSSVTFISSAGIGVLAKHYKDLTQIGGAFVVVNPSKPVAAVLRITRLADLLMTPGGAVAPVPAEAPSRRVERDGFAFDVFGLDAGAQLTCRAIGNAAPLATASFNETDSASLQSLSPTFAIGVGAFGDSFDDCRPRFGELLSVAGATTYQPADGTNVADYLLSEGPLGPDIRVLYCLACEGGFSHLIRFEALHDESSLGLTRLLEMCLDQIGAPSMGVVVVAETAGLVGAALRRSPAQPVEGGAFFAHPGVQARLTFTAERAYSRSVALAAGVVTRDGSAGDGSQLRPMGDTLNGHVHAAAFRFRPLRKGRIDLAETVKSLFEPERLLGVLHLLNDNRSGAGAGDSEIIRGACWLAPLESCSF
jgi:anti-anti-sigma factor